MEEKIIDGILHFKEDNNWIAYTPEVLTLLLKKAQLDAELQYVKGQRDQIDKDKLRFEAMFKEYLPKQSP